MKYSRTGFTIVELLIVVVVIAILAAITIVSYNGIQARASDAVVQNDLSNFAKAMAIHTINDGPLHGENPGESIAWALEKLDWSAAKDSYDTSVYGNLLFCHNYSPSSIATAWGTSANGRTNWALVALSKSGSVYYVTQDGAPAKYDSDTTLDFSEFGNACGTMITYLGAEGFVNVYGGYRKTDTATGPWRTWTGAGN